MTSGASGLDSLSGVEPPCLKRPFSLDLSNAGVLGQRHRSQPKPRDSPDSRDIPVEQAEEFTAVLTDFGYDAQLITWRRGHEVAPDELFLSTLLDILDR